MTVPLRILVRLTWPSSEDMRSPCSWLLISKPRNTALLACSWASRHMYSSNEDLRLLGSPMMHHELLGLEATGDVVDAVEAR